MNSLPRLDSKQCEAFLTVIDCGSFEQAALTLHLTASAVSQRVKALEIQSGTTLLVRSRPCRATPAGQKLLQHLRRIAEMERDLQLELRGASHAPVSIALAVNADSLDSWTLPALSDLLTGEQILLDLTIDDQEHTDELLSSGMVLGCISAKNDAMRGCIAEPLGVMRYHAVATRTFCDRWFPQGMTRSAACDAPVLNFNRKDRLQADFLMQHFGLHETACTAHFIPATSAYLRAVCLGLGWGMIPDLMLDQLPAGTTLVQLMPAHPVDVALYWHHWKIQTPRLARLSAALVNHAREILLQR
ncbi:HTH-type transcriptional regulator ArgP [Undibacterium oligocarboniphilum]|uniref:HTH-type transcriptional regulator ArgP n=1 Tax=Undibacterium oligocarboniphilum TaxID=666702 RepID=A0A850QKN6_9BURK|nr:HTH-type transcriptional regulator ArgP [Undibacterium oligocarboniphilum]MBC3869687.1 HTH-type transcriptional regulator ArgP [Undibacterium oligocarboniphilum]NVO77290.1 HTH-type transcriptional regulator ArgP [Undibacterium oligocarboniphilum]